jgi:hypothetical protein
MGEEKKGKASGRFSVEIRQKTFALMFIAARRSDPEPDCVGAGRLDGSPAGVNHPNVWVLLVRFWVASLRSQ